MSVIACCPGTYDPVTLGHLDIIERASRIFGQVVVLVTEGTSRKTPMFTTHERMEFVRQGCTHLANVSVEPLNELVVQRAMGLGATVLVKGLRAISDFDYEFQMAQINRHLSPEIETVYMPASPKYSFISSSGLKEIAVWGGRVDDWVPPYVAAAFRERLPGDGNLRTV